MSDTFVGIVQRASQLGWCTRPYCTTCGNREVQAELRKVAGEAGFELAEQLSGLSTSEIVSLPNWDDCIRLAFFEIILPGPQERVLESWLHNLDKEVYFADVVLFYIVRSLPFGQTIGARWIEKCISLALDTRNESLTESLLWTLRGKVNNYPALHNLAKQMTSSPKVAKALSACMIETM